MRTIFTNTGVIHFVGIGGIGMSGIADVLLNLGYRITGSDIKENSMIERLARKGAKIAIGHKAENARGASVVVISSAISNDNPEVLEARKLSIPVVRRAEMLAELMRMKNSVAVAGTHGKTTTTSLIAAVLDQAGMNPTVINGGVINAYNSNARLGTGDWAVVEADESDGSFTKLMSTIAVVTNIDFDHIDNFKNFSELRDLFTQFVKNIPFYGAAILCADHPETVKVALSIMDRRVITYGLSKTADVSCEDLQQFSNGLKFSAVFSDEFSKKYKISKCKWENISLPMFGKHNAQNALAAISAAVELGISEENVKLAFRSFMGVKRRFTCVAKVNGVTIIDDYAHHPVEIAAVLNAARTSCKGKIYAVMQPHRHTRLKNFLEDFAKVLELSDHVFIAPIYSAGERDNGVNHFDLLKKIQENAVIKADFVHDIQELKEKIFDMLHPNDFVIFLGAGSITHWTYAFPKMIDESAR